MCFAPHSKAGGWRVTASCSRHSCERNPEYGSIVETKWVGSQVPARPPVHLPACPPVHVSACSHARSPAYPRAHVIAGLPQVADLMRINEGAVLKAGNVKALLLQSMRLTVKPRCECVPACSSVYVLTWSLACGLPERLTARFELRGNSFSARKRKVSRRSRRC